MLHVCVLQMSIFLYIHICTYVWFPIGNWLMPLLGINESPCELPSLECLFLLPWQLWCHCCIANESPPELSCWEFPHYISSLLLASVSSCCYHQHYKKMLQTAGGLPSWEFVILHFQFMLSENLHDSGRLRWSVMGLSSKNDWYSLSASGVRGWLIHSYIVKIKINIQ